MTATIAPLRATLTLNCRINSTRDVPQDWLEVAPEPKVTVQRAPAAPQNPAPALPPYYDRIKSLLDRWAEWQPTAGGVGHGAPRRSACAPDARIHSVEDMEIECNKLIFNAVDTAVWELPVLERESVMLNYGITKAANGWRADFDRLFDLAITSMYGLLKNRISC